MVIFFKAFTSIGLPFSYHRLTLLSLIIGYPVAYFLALYVENRYKSILLFLITLPFLTNLLIQIYAWYFILEKNGLLNKFLSLFFY